MPVDTAFYNTLPPAPPHFGSTGALEPSHDGRDRPPELHPQVAAALLAGVPNEADRSAGVCEILNQGAAAACVVFSTCTGIQLDNNLDRQICYHFAAAQMYAELGGSGSNGIDTRAELQACVDKGAPLVGGGRVKIGSYFRCDNEPTLFVEQIKAAVSTGQVVVIALLLPTTFSGVWTPGAPTQAYHQLVISGYRGDIFWGPNTWGSGWGGGQHPPGFYELSFQYCVANGFQGGYCYAFFFDPFEVHGIPPPPPPPPPPAKRYFLSGELLGPGAPTIIQGQVLTLGNVAATLLVSETHQTGGDPTPLPGELTVNVYRQGTFRYITAQEPGSTAYVNGSVAVVVGGVSVPAYLGKNRSIGGAPAIFRLTGVSGAGTATFTADDQRQGSAPL